MVRLTEAQITHLPRRGYIAFMSLRADERHQYVLATNQSSDESYSPINQMQFVEVRLANTQNAVNANLSRLPPGHGCEVLHASRDRCAA